MSQDIVIAYFNIFNNMFVGFMMSGAYLYMLYIKFSQYLSIEVIVRIDDKRKIPSLQLTDVLSTAFQVTISLNILYLCMGFINAKDILYDEMILMVGRNVISEFTGLASIGTLYMLILNVINKKTLSLIITEIITLYFFMAQSVFFTLKWLFYDIYDFMTYNMFSETYNDYIKELVLSICVTMILYIIGRAVYLRKGIYGEKIKNESSW